MGNSASGLSNADREFGDVPNKRNEDYRRRHGAAAIVYNFRDLTEDYDALRRYALNLRAQAVENKENAEEEIERVKRERDSQRTRLETEKVNIISNYRAAMNRQAQETAARQTRLNSQLRAYREAQIRNANADEERQQALIEEANRRREARQREVNAARTAAAELRSDNECTDNQDIVRQHIERQRRVLETQNQLNIAENERQQRMSELERQNIQQEERLAQQSARFDYAGRAQISVDFLDRNDENQNDLLPVNLPQSDNIDELSNSADVTINNVFTNHYNKNLTTYMDNRIKINDMKNKIDKLNSNLNKKINNNITYGTDGEMTFH